jgi:cation/acetate symporter
VLGFAAGTIYLVYIQNGGTQILGLDGLRFAIIGMPVSLVAMVVVSLMTEEPDAETQAMVDDIRDPTGKAILAQDQPEIVGGGICNPAPDAV